MKIQQKSIKVWINLNKGELKDPQNITKDVSIIGHLGNGDYEINVSDKRQVGSTIELVKQSYKY